MKAPRKRRAAPPAKRGRQPLKPWQRRLAFAAGGLARPAAARAGAWAALPSRWGCPPPCVQITSRSAEMSSGPAGTTSTWPFRISDRPDSAFGRWVPTTFQALA